MAAAADLGCLSLVWRSPTSPQVNKGLFADPMFGFHDWDKHRNATRRHSLTPIVFLRSAYGFIWLLIWVVLLSIGVALYHKYAVPRGAPHTNADNLMVPFTMITFAVSLLILFKTNSSYARWWEGRDIWGVMLNYSRDLPRQLLAYTQPSTDVQLAHARRDVLRVALRWMAASVYVLKGHLRKKTSAKAEEEAAHLLTPGEREYLRTYWANRPQGVAFVLSWLCTHRALGLNMQQQVAIQNQIGVFVDGAGGCEKIQSSPIPSAYTRHTSRFLLFFVTFVPIAMWPAIGWATPVIAPLISFLLLGTENIGVQIEEPFKVLPLDAICQFIEAGMRDLASASLTEPGADKAPWQLDALPEAVVLSRQKHAVKGSAPAVSPHLPRVLGLDMYSELRDTGLWAAGTGPVVPESEPGFQPVAGSAQRSISHATHNSNVPHLLLSKLHGVPEGPTSSAGPAASTSDESYIGDLESDRRSLSPFARVSAAPPSGPVRDSDARSGVARQVSADPASRTATSQRGNGVVSMTRDDLNYLLARVQPAHGSKKGTTEVHDRMPRDIHDTQERLQATSRYPRSVRGGADRGGRGSRAGSHFGGDGP